MAYIKAIKSWGKNNLISMSDTRFRIHQSKNKNFNDTNIQFIRDFYEGSFDWFIKWRLLWENK